MDLNNGIFCKVKIGTFRLMHARFIFELFLIKKAYSEIYLNERKEQEEVGVLQESMRVQQYKVSLFPPFVLLLFKDIWKIL